MAGKDAAGNKVVNVAKALNDRAKRMAAAPKTIKLRATQRGYYGRPLPDLIDPGTVFAFAVKDLEPAGKHKDRANITVEGVEYELPTWCEDASNPVTVEDEEQDEEQDEAGTSTDDVI